MILLDRISPWQVSADISLWALRLTGGLTKITLLRIIGGFGMDNKHELRKKTIGLDLVCVFGGVFVAIIGFLFINYFINAGTQKQLYYILAWLIPANAILFSFWFLIFGF